MTSGPRIAIYTCITANYDPLLTPTRIDPRIDYICFSDTDGPPVMPWVRKRVSLPGHLPKDLNRHVKMHPHVWLPDYDATVYIDGNIDIVGDVYALVRETLSRRADVFLYDHFARNCVFAEAAHCSHFSHDWVWTIAAQMRRYSAERYPTNNGLFDGSVIIRRRSEAMIRLMEGWWSEYRQGAGRDQLSLPVVARRLGIPVLSLGENDAHRLGRCFRFRGTHASSTALNTRRTVRKYVNRAIASTISYQRLFGLDKPLRGA